MNFPSNPSENDVYSFGGRQWYFNGYGWVLSTQTAGEKGSKGDKGDKGEKGEEVRIVSSSFNNSNNTATFTNSDTSTFTLNGIKGQKGEGDKGQKGDKGEKGTKGDKGDKGEKGQKGELTTGASYDDSTNALTFINSDGSFYSISGIKGNTGEKGIPGEAAFKGDKGDKGSDGPVGSTGEKGDKGIPGEAAFKGDKGDTGAKGDGGSKGDKGEKGTLGGFGITVDSFVANGSSNTFTLSTTPIDENHTVVVLNSVVQLKDAYSVSGNILTISETPESNSIIEVSSFSGGTKGDKGDLPSVVGPYTDDSNAALNGVAVGSLYYRSTGIVYRRLA